MGCHQSGDIMSSKVWYVIPARKGSKGLPGKNRKLFNYTASTIPLEERKNVIVTSDDDYILSRCATFGILGHNRTIDLSNDFASTRDVLIDVVSEFNICKNDIVVLLYLTYPERSWSDIDRAIKMIKNKKANSLLCRKEIESTPYLMMFEEADLKGTKVINHDLCRRQDYKKCFEMSHYVGAFRAGNLRDLDTNLWSIDTIFMTISNKIDVDHKSDLDQFLTEKK